LNRWIGKVL